MAARTDDDLRALSLDINERILQVIIETFRRLFPTARDEQTAGTLIRTVFAMFIGLTLQNALDDDAHGHQAAVLLQVKGFARLLISDPA